MQKQTPSPGPLDAESEPTPQLSTQLPAPVSSAPSSSSTPESSESSTPRSIEILPQSSSSKELVSRSTGSTPAPLRIPLGGRIHEDYSTVEDPISVPLPICRLCRKPVDWIRVQPDVGKGKIKVTVGCRHSIDGGERTATFWMELSDLLSATEINPGEAF